MDSPASLINFALTPVNIVNAYHGLQVELSTNCREGLLLILELKYGVDALKIPAADRTVSLYLTDHVPGVETTLLSEGFLLNTYKHH